MLDTISLQPILGYKFNNMDLLTQALTHKSYGKKNNERLEHLGDSILGYCITEELFTRFPHAQEGGLSWMRSQFVCGKALAAKARALNIQHYLLCSDAALQGNHNNHDRILEDSFEAVIAAIHLDGGLDEAKDFILRLYKSEIERFSLPKRELNEYLKKHNLPLPVYKTIKQSGEPHAPFFTVECRIKNTEPVSATSSRRHFAEQESARKVLELIRRGQIQLIGSAR